MPAVVATTECFPAISPECTINIHINIAFSYNESEISQNQIDAWVNEIETTWNGDAGYQTYGDCGCKVKFQVNAMKVTDPTQINCSPGPPGYHCVMITDHNKNQPKNTAGNATYRGYMYGVSKNGSSVNGWWSNEMGEPHPDSPTGENALDAAHEAGHMLGLGDDYDKGPPPRYGNNLMGTTHGPDAKPTQDQIDQVVENVCPDDCCPDECCCGNGIVEDDKGEICDPMADPTGCGEDTTLYCCKICCQCHRQQCMPELGAYATQEDCQAACKNGNCYFNYNTGCWDCKEHDVVETPSPASSEPAQPGGPDGSGTARPEPVSGMLSIAGILALILGGGFILGGVKKENKSFLVGGGVMAMVGFLILVALAVNATIEKPIGVTKPADSGPGTIPIPTMVSMSELPGPEPQPAEDPEEEILKDKRNVTPPPVTAAGPVNETPDASETHVTTPTITCGDRKCSVTENCSTCQADCGRCPYCGDKKCLGSETCSNCKKDCGNCPPVCGDSDCKGNEDCESCEDDCGECEEEPDCEDGVCEGDEDCESCPEDCGECGPECGNDMCEVGEDCECSDCECPPGLYCSPEFSDADPIGCSHFGGATCGNGLCDETEYCYTCPIDCKCGPETCCLPSNPGIGCGTC